MWVIYNLDNVDEKCFHHDTDTDLSRRSND